MRWDLLRVWLCVMAALNAECLASEPPSRPHLPPPQYSVRQWTSADGLPANTVQCLVQTRDGYLWIGTRNGLVRFNGSQFKVILEGNCRSLAEDKEGALWIGTMNGLFRWSEGEMRHVPITPPVTPPEPEEISRLCSAATGGVWGWDGAGLWRAAGEEVKRFPAAAALPKSAFFWEDSNRRLWIGEQWSGLTWWDCRREQLMQVDQHEWERYAYRVFEDSRERLWFFASLQVLCLDRGRKTIFQIGTDIGRFDLCEDREGTLWVANDGDLWRIDDKEASRAPLVDGLKFGEITALARNRDGGIWVGTEYNGLYLLLPRPVRVLMPPQGFAYNDVWSITEAHDGSVWAGTSSGALHFVAGECENYDMESGLRTPQAMTVAQDRAGQVWVGTYGSSWGGYGGALHQFRNDPPHSFKASDGFGRADITALTPSSDGTLWVLSTAGLTRGRGGQFVHFPSIKGIIAFVDAQTNVWVGGHAVYFLPAGDPNRAVPKPFGPGLKAAMLQDETGAIWFATSEQGLLRLKNDKNVALSMKHGLPTNLILCILEDDYGRYWFNTHIGIFSARKRDLNEVADGKRELVTCIRYGTEDGMLSTEGNGGNYPNSCKTRDGLLWFPTTKGLAVVDPRLTLLDDTPPPLVIEEMRVGGEVMFQNSPEVTSWIAYRRDIAGNQVVTNQSLSRASKEIRLPPGRGRGVMFTYVANTFGADDKALFRYKLEGRDHEWTEAGPQRTARLEDLPPGRYVFRVTAANHRGVWNPQGAQLAFHVTPFFYQTWPFYIGCVGGVLGLATGLHHLRMKGLRRIKELERLRAVDQERARIAHDLHDDLGAGLTRIALLSEVARRELDTTQAAATHIERISSVAGEVVDSIGELVWAANPKYDNLSSLAAYFRSYVLQFFEGSGVEVHVDMPGDANGEVISAEFRRHLFLILKEAVRNIARHSRATRVHVQLSVKGKALEMVIRDNGLGFVPNKQPAFHHGLENMRERAARLGGAVNIVSEPGKGTRIALTAQVDADLRLASGSVRSSYD